MMFKPVYGLALLGAVALAACDDDDQMMVPSTESQFEVRVENVSNAFDFTSSGSFSIPSGSGAAGPLLPGGVYEFEFSAAPGSKLSFATMFVQSNDLFFAPDGAGIELFDAQGVQITGDVTDQIMLWDAGTEVDQEPGLGLDQAPRQGGADAGAVDTNATVRLAEDTFGNLPAVSDVITVTLDSTGPTSFRLRVTNVSTAATISTSDGMMHAAPLAPGVWAVHTGSDPFFTAGAADRGEGLEGLAEDGSAGGLADVLNARSGLTSPLAPGAFAVHSAPSALFRAGMSDTGMGLEALAEDGDPSGLSAALASQSGVRVAGAFNTPAGAAGPAPAFPGEAYTFTFTADVGDRLSFATMLVQSNDLFFAPAEAGLDLFPGGVALSGNVTGMVLLWDAGTEVNEAPGVGLNQAPRQAGADTGTDESGVVRQVNDGYAYPDVAAVVRVTITPIG
jgi:hypothetical protein